MKKHIITFNNFQPIHENWNDNDYFKLVSKTEGYDLMQTIIDVTDEDFNVVISCLDNIKYEMKFSTWGIFGRDSEGRGKMFNYKYILASRKGFSYKVFKLPDEWYLVILSDEVNGVDLYYLCDQLEGLKHFLKK